MKLDTLFCVTFSEKYRDGADVDELKGLVINLSLTMRPDSVNPNSSQTEQANPLYYFIELIVV
ncbi:hypothetical protein VWU69_004424 [Salmonella enterica]|nr:hypothetical protein [Salmonella enterica]EIF0629163.1 hypothetical protein [Salmonella enterica]EKO1001508.1 hypothetical protein [Salmonella enterica subsp. enterica]ELS3679602.1 hypothetical protein [Salmonella enterica]EME1046911.1 hypothetical protein [Salmonella enterica]